MRSRGTSKSVVSRRFVAKTAAQLAAWQTASLDKLALIGLLIDGVPIIEHCRIVALGIAADRQKHALGLWDAVRAIVREAALVQRCQVHKTKHTRIPQRPRSALAQPILRRPCGHRCRTQARGPRGPRHKLFQRL